jgi:hypothetical protein
MDNSKRLAAVAATVLAGLLSIAAPATAATTSPEGRVVEESGGINALAANRPLFQLPFACGESWRLQTYAGHDDYDIDMFKSTGSTNNQPILASYGGKVIRSGWDNGGGNYVRIDHGNGWNTLYLHMIAAPIVDVGDTVTLGQQLGKVGSTGSSSAPHLHYEQNLNGNKIEAWFNGSPSGITDDGSSTSRTLKSKNCGGGQQIDPVEVYGVLKTGELYYTVIDSAKNARTHTVRSTKKLDFVPKALVALNRNTLLATTPGGGLHRIDVITNNNSLAFNITADPIESGWTHDTLAFDGAYLYGIAGNVLSRYFVTKAKPGAAQISTRQEIAGNWTLETLTATAPGWLLGVNVDGSLQSYRINGKARDFDRFELKSGGWASIDQLISAGDGYYLGRATDGSMNPYTDADPFDGKGSDMVYGKNVDDQGWTQHLITAVPNFTD